MEINKKKPVRVWSGKDWILEDVESVRYFCYFRGKRLYFRDVAEAMEAKKVTRVWRETYNLKEI